MLHGSPESLVVKVLFLEPLPGNAPTCTYFYKPLSVLEEWLFDKKQRDAVAHLSLSPYVST